MTCFHHYFPLSTWYSFYLYKDPLSLLGWLHPSLLVHFSQNTTSRIKNLQLHAIFSVKKSIVLKIILIFHSLQLKSYLLFCILYHCNSREYAYFFQTFTVLEYWALFLVTPSFFSIRNISHLFLFRNLRRGDILVQASPLSCCSGL